ncbi:hypothetical protein Tco_0338372, partial [Tanacetum coccineum]
GSLSKHSIVSNDGLRGGGFVVVRGRLSSMSKSVRAGGGEVKGGGVLFRVSRILFGVILRDFMGESGGEAFRVDGGAD